MCGTVMRGTVYTESVVYAAPEALVGEAPYQIAIVVHDDGSRVTARLTGERVAIGDTVEFVERRGGAPIYKKV